jgi:hypothetical protein
MEIVAIYNDIITIYATKRKKPRPYYQFYEKSEHLFARQLIHSPRRIDFPENHQEKSID